MIQFSTIFLVVPTLVILAPEGQLNSERSAIAGIFGAIIGYTLSGVGGPD